MIKINIEAENLNELKAVFAYLGQIAGTPLQQLPSESTTDKKPKELKQEQQPKAIKEETLKVETPVQDDKSEITHDSLRELMQGMSKENRKSAVAHLKKTYSIEGIADIQETDLQEAYNAIKDFA